MDSGGKAMKKKVKTAGNPLLKKALFLFFFQPFITDSSYVCKWSGT